MRGSAAFRAAVAPGGALAGPWVKNELWRRARAVPSLDLRFAENKSLVDATTGANLVTFTRASSATFVDSQGTIQRAVTNLQINSEDFSGATLTRGTVTTNAGTAPNGTQTAELFLEDTQTGNHIIGAPTGTPAVASGLAYTYSVFIKPQGRTSIRVSANQTATLPVDSTFTLTGTGSASVTLGSASVEQLLDGWYRCSVSATATASATTGFSHRTSTSTGDNTLGIYLWGAQLEQSSTVGEYVPTTSTINSAPRFDHNPTTGESLGLLVEEQRTNLALQSQDMATTWATTSATVTANSDVAPDGTTTADTITASSSIIGRVQQTITFTGDGDKAISVWLKAGTAPTSTIKIDDSTAGFTLRLSLTITWTNGVASGSTTQGTLQGIDAYPNGWYRIRALATGVVAANTNRYRIEADSTNGTGSVIAWGAQAENGAFATSYIPTTTATVTRSADVASISGAAFSSWYRQDEGTMFAEAPLGSGSRANAAIFCISNGDGGSFADKHMTVRVVGTSGSGSTRSVVNDVTSQADFNFSDSSSMRRMAMAYKDSDFQAASTGALSAVDTSGTVPLVDRALLGTAPFLANGFLCGHVRRVTYWPRRLPGSSLQSIT